MGRRRRRYPGGACGEFVGWGDYGGRSPRPIGVGRSGGEPAKPVIGITHYVTPHVRIRVDVFIFFGNVPGRS